MTHPDNDTLLQWLDGELHDEARSAELRVHVAICNRCALAVHGANAAGRALRTWADELPVDADITDAVLRTVDAPHATLAGSPPAALPSEALFVRTRRRSVVSISRVLLPALAVAATVMLVIARAERPRIKPQGAPVALEPDNPVPAVGASVARVEVVGAQSYAVLEVPGLEAGSTTSVVWIQDDPDDLAPGDSPMALQ